MMWFDYGSMWFLGPLMMLVFWGGLIVLAIWAIRSFSPRQGSSHDAALDVLKRRLAAGEITEAEYEQTRKALQG